MKASLKVREDQRPLVRAKVPVQLCGLPLFSGITSGDPGELAIHVGTATNRGPAVRLSYKPNDSESPFAVLLKAGFGVWGSPRGAALAFSAEVNLSSTGTPSFAFRLKPKFGDFGFRKDSSSVTVAFTSEEGKDREEGSFSFEDKIKSLGKGDEKRGDTSIRALSYDGFSSPNGTPTDLSPPNNLVNGHNKVGGPFSVKEKIQSYSNGPIDKNEGINLNVKPGIPSDTFKDGSSDAGSIEDGFTPVFNIGQSALDNARDTEKGVTRRKSGRVESLVSSSTSGWSMSAHSALPFGNRALAKVRWSMRFGSSSFQNLREGFSISDVRLPTLTVDKFSIEAVDPYHHQRGKNSSEGMSLVPAFIYNGEDSNDSIERLASTCMSMKYQLQLLHSENKLLKKSVDEIRMEVVGKRGPSKSAELLCQEENALKAQLFDDINTKADGGNGKVNGKFARGKPRDGGHSRDQPPKAETQDVVRLNGIKSLGSADSASARDPVSEELKKAIMNATGG